MILSSTVPNQTGALEVVIRTLREVLSEFSSVGGSAKEQLDNYRQLVTKHARTLASYFTHADLERLLLTQRYWALFPAEVTTSNSRVIADTVQTERDDRMRSLDALIKEYQQVQQSWNDDAGDPVVAVLADTNIYLHQDAYFNEIDWPSLFGGRRIRLLVPIVVVDELDVAKRAGKSITVSDTNKESIRSRARITIRRLRDLFEDPGARVPIGVQTEAELLLNSMDHRRIDDSDAEIIERALTLGQLIGTEVMLVTSDGGMQFRARSAGVPVRRLD